MGPNNGLPAPAYTGTGGSSWGPSGGGFNWQGMGNGLGSVLGSLFGGDAGAPFQAAEGQYQQYANQANQGQMPFWQVGTGAIPQYQNWLISQQDPSGYINKMMGQYQQSPYAKYLTDQAMKAGQNAASASGLQGSTPFAQQMAATAGGISSQDLNNWLSQVLGINTQYGQGLGREIGWGQDAADQMSNTYNHLGDNMAQAEKDRVSAQQNQTGNLFGGLGSLFGDVAGGLGLF